MAGILIANFFVRRVFFLAAAPTAYFSISSIVEKRPLYITQLWPNVIANAVFVSLIIFYFTITCLLSVVKNLSKTQ
jgi:hypothetical protein